MDDQVHFSRGIGNAYEQGTHDANNDLPMQETSNKSYQHGYESVLRYRRSGRSDAGPITISAL